MATSKIKSGRYRELPQRSDAAINEYLRLMAEDTAGTARRLVHVVSGETRDSIKVIPGRREAIVRVGGAGIVEELGTPFRPPHPFLLPAVGQTKRKSTRFARRALRRVR